MYVRRYTTLLLLRQPKTHMLWEKEGGGCVSFGLRLSHAACVCVPYVRLCGDIGTRKREREREREREGGRPCDESASLPPLIQKKSVWGRRGRFAKLVVVFSSLPPCLPPSLSPFPWHGWRERSQSDEKKKSLTSMIIFLPFYKKNSAKKPFFLTKIGLEPLNDVGRILNWFQNGFHKKLPWATFHQFFFWGGEEGYSLATSSSSKNNSPLLSSSQGPPLFFGGA